MTAKKRQFFQAIFFCTLEYSNLEVERITAYVSTMNPGIPADGNNIINSIPLPKIPIRFQSW